jgi:hemolysin activation/secretion protein
LIDAALGDPAEDKTSTLANEIYLAFRGQYAFGYRLIPPEMSIAGGLYTVRGYKEAAATGDTTLIGNVEYRLHIPRLFRPSPPVEVPYVGPFRWAPQQAFGEADWDLIVRTFFDVGRVIRSDPTAFELNETLLGAGLGVELQLKRNLSARLDYGWILKSLETSSNQQTGDGRVNFAVRVLY